MAVFEPDENECIHICRNPGGLDGEIIIRVADRIEAHFLSATDLGAHERISLIEPLGQPVKGSFTPEYKPMEYLVTQIDTQQPQLEAEIDSADIH